MLRFFLHTVVLSIFEEVLCCPLDLEEVLHTDVEFYRLSLLLLCHNVLGFALFLLPVYTFLGYYLYCCYSYPRNNALFNEFQQWAASCEKRSRILGPPRYEID